MSGEIQKVFDKDPMEMTKQDLDTIIDYMRRARAEFAAGDKRAGTEPRKKKTSKKEQRAEGIEVDL